MRNIANPDLSTRESDNLDFDFLVRPLLTAHGDGVSQIMDFERAKIH